MRPPSDDPPAVAAHAVPFQCRIEKPSGPAMPTAQTSRGPLPQTPDIWGIAVPLATETHAAPFQRTMAPVVPTAQTSFGPVPQTLTRDWVVGLVTGIQPAPSQCRMVPIVPTAQTSFELLPQTA